MNQTSSFTYKEVRFLGFENAEFDNIRRNFFATDEENATLFFQAANCLLAVTPVYSFDDDFPLGQILKSVQDAVDYLGIVVDRNVQISTETYLVTSDFIDIYWKTSYPKEIGEMQLNLLEDTPFIFLEKFSGQAKIHILNQESTFIGAIKSEDIEGYWRYLENLFAHKGAQAVIDIVSTILLLNEKLDRDDHITQYLFSSTSPWNFDYQRFGMTPAEFIAIRNKLGLKKAKHFLENFDYPFFNELIKILSKRYTKKRWSNLQRYYNSLLLQLYEARNGITHANLLHNKAYFKLELTIPPIVTRVRRLLFSYVRIYPTLAFQELIEIILQDAKNNLP